MTYDHVWRYSSGVPILGEYFHPYPLALCFQETREGVGGVVGGRAREGV